MIVEWVIEFILDIDWCFMEIDLGDWERCMLNWVEFWVIVWVVVLRIFEWWVDVIWLGLRIGWLFWLKGGSFLVYFMILVWFWIFFLFNNYVVFGRGGCWVSLIKLDKFNFWILWLLNKVRDFIFIFWIIRFFKVIRKFCNFFLLLLKEMVIWGFWVKFWLFSLVRMFFGFNLINICVFFLYIVLIWFIYFIDFSRCFESWLWIVLIFIL